MTIDLTGIKEITEDIVLEACHGDKLSITEVVRSDEPGLIVGDHAFEGCENLTCLWHNKNLIEIGNYAFCKCRNYQTEKLDNLINLRYIGNHAFEGCENIEYLDIGLCNNIGNYAFKDCINLSEIKNIFSYLETIQNINAFENTPLYKYIDFNKKLTSNIKFAIVYVCDNNIEYIKKCLNSIESFRYNNRYLIDIYILVNNDFKYKDKILKSFHYINFIEVNIENIKKCYYSSRWTLTTLYKFELFNIKLFRQYSSVLVIDSDTEILANIKKLFILNCIDNPILGVKESTTYVFNNLKYNILNCGLLVFNMKKLSNIINLDNFYNQCLNIGIKEYLDQEILNELFYTKYNNLLGELDSIYNTFWHTYDYHCNIKKRYSYSWEKNSYIRHYICNEKYEFDKYIKCKKII